MEALVAALNGQGAPIDELSRVTLQDALRGAADALETPHDLMLRLFNSVCCV